MIFELESEVNPAHGHWNYRVIRHLSGDDFILSIHAVYYEADGSVRSWSADPVGVHGEDRQELLWTLKRMQRATKRRSLRIVDEALLEEGPGGGLAAVLQRRRLATFAGLAAWLGRGPPKKT